ncbi:7 transmembrane receptor [Oesophagostomum dentatum]|uniref:7 transmembrane receptor n=1 Tax=Oesophagostomum dentatum TaxID=61180 RepID=A0A0B1TD73_OESDE|nr:7 transmembrane receptor [Oesophagostomum dentatum]
MRFYFRYYSVKQLKVASNRRQCMKAICISLAIWVVSFLLSLPLLLYYDTTMLYVVKDVNVLDEKGGVKLRSYGWRQCRLAPSRSTTLEMSTQEIQLLMSVLQVVSLYIVPLFVLSIFNVKLTRFLKTNANQMAKNRSESRRRRIDAQENARKNGEFTGTRSQSIPSMRSSIAERASERRTSRTTALLIAMAGSYAALWLPFTLISLLLDLDILYVESHVAVIERIDQTCKMVSMLSICVNPFLYGFLNTNFRHEFSEIYFRYVLCRAKATGNARFHHDFSSLAVSNRNNSVYVGVSDADSGLCSILRRSFAGSLDRLRSMRSEPNTSSSVSNKQHNSTAATEHLLPDTDHLGCDRIVLDADSEKDSFV